MCLLDWLSYFSVKRTSSFVHSFILSDWPFNWSIDRHCLETSVGRYRGTTMEPRYFFFTVPVPSRSRYYRGTAIPHIPGYYRTVEVIAKVPSRYYRVPRYFFTVLTVAHNRWYRPTLVETDPIRSHWPCREVAWDQPTLNCNRSHIPLRSSRRCSCSLGRRSCLSVRCHWRLYIKFVHIQQLFV